MVGGGAIALGDSLAPLPRHLRVNLGTEDHCCTRASVLVHPRQREGLRVLRRCYKKHIISNEA